MMSPLLCRPTQVQIASGQSLIQRITPEAMPVGFDWQLLSMEVCQLQQGHQWTHSTGQTESVIVILGGQCRVESNRGHWQKIGRRETVFDGMPWALYFSRETEFTLTALSGQLEIAYAWVPTDEDHPAQLITPADSQIEIRGGDHANRQINSIIPPGFDCQRLVCVEVFTPGGNWSSYPPHKHDRHQMDSTGTLIEADLEEIYFYKIRNTVDKPNGYAIQRVYTDDRSLDETITVHDNDLVFIPEGYHPVSAAYGYDCYYLNFLAGSAQSLACVDDPDYAWIKELPNYSQIQDPRLPLVSHAMETPQAEREALPV